MHSQNVITPALDGYENGVNLLDGYAIASSFNSQAIPVHRVKGFSFMVYCPSTGSPVGTFKLQGCNDVERREGVADSGLVNWFDVSSGGNRVVSQAVNGATTAMLTDTDCFYRWVRLVYTRTSGTITATVKLQCKTIK